MLDKGLFFINANIDDGDLAKMSSNFAMRPLSAVQNSKSTGERRPMY